MTAVTNPLRRRNYSGPAPAAADRPLRARLGHAGRPIAGSDLLVAARAVALRPALLTDNEVGFARIDGLARENRRREP